MDGELSVSPIECMSKAFLQFPIQSIFKHFAIASKKLTIKRLPILRQSQTSSDILIVFYDGLRLAADLIKSVRCSGGLVCSNAKFNDVAFDGYHIICSTPPGLNVAFKTCGQTTKTTLSSCELLKTLPPYLLKCSHI